MAEERNNPGQTIIRRRLGQWEQGSGAMNVLSAEASDPAIVVTFREDKSAGTYVVAVLLPAGYEHPGKEILIKTDDPQI